MKHFKITLLLMLVLGITGYLVPLSFAGGDLESGEALRNDSKTCGARGENSCNACHRDEKGLENTGQESHSAGPTISFNSTGWDGTKSVYQVAGTATFTGGGIDAVEYFVNDGDTPGTGVMISGGSGLSPFVFTFSVREIALRPGDNTICVHALSSTSVWGSLVCLTATK